MRRNNVRMKKYVLIIILFVWATSSITAQSKKGLKEMKAPHPVCYASDKVEKSFIPPPAEFLLKSGSPTCDIIVNYISFPTEAKNAFEYAVGIWETMIESDIPIRMDARWNSSMAANTLGSCGPETYYADFKDAPFENRYYPVAIAEKIANEELNGNSRADIEANFNSKINWYFRTDGAAPDTTYDFVTVVLHEIAHGLGFTGFFFVDEDLGGYGFYEMGDATSFDQLVVRNTGIELLDTAIYKNLSTELKVALESSALYAESPVAKTGNGGLRPRLYAPVDFDSGSSIYHLNDASYDKSENSLMTHAVGRGEAIHDPGPLTKGIMDDIGWRNLFIRYDAPKDMEKIGPIDFEVTFESDYELDTSSLNVTYSTDGFKSHSETIPLVFSDETSFFSSTISPGNGIDSISYYVSAKDKKNRVRTSPSLAPQKWNSVKFGPDIEKPVITHTPIPYFLLRGKAMEITVEVEDNLGVDTVYLEYSLNGIEQTPFSLTWDYKNKYSGIFTVDIQSLKDGDKIEYRIIARDKSSAQNQTKLPLLGKFSFEIEEIFEAVNTYINDFNQKGSDFILSDFDIYTADNFENGALHSIHPYLSPNTDNKDFNFSTFLKRPIVIAEEGSMTFDEVVLVEPGELLADFGDDEFWDYVIVEGSKDYGEIWWPLADGYDSGDKSVWKQNYNDGIVGQESRTVGTSEWFFNREISLLDSKKFEVGDTILIRFRLYSDPYANAWGWAIDNLRIQQPTAVGEATLLPRDVKVYPNPFNNSVKVNIWSINESSNVQIEVFDLLGRKVYSDVHENVIGELDESIDLTHLGKGMFLIKVSENGKPVLSKKLIKN